MSWTPMILDEQGWEDLVAILFRALEELIGVKEDSAERLIARDAKGTSCTVSILGYPSANEDRKVGPSIEVDEDEGPVEKSREGERAKGPSRRKPASKKAKPTAKGPTGKAATQSKRRKSPSK